MPTAESSTEGLSRRGSGDAAAHGWPRMQTTACSSSTPAPSFPGPANQVELSKAPTARLADPGIVDPSSCPPAGGEIAPVSAAAWDSMAHEPTNTKQCHTIAAVAAATSESSSAAKPAQQWLSNLQQLSGAPQQGGRPEVGSPVPSSQMGRASGGGGGLLLQEVHSLKASLEACGQAGAFKAALHLLQLLQALPMTPELLATSQISVTVQQLAVQQAAPDASAAARALLSSWKGLVSSCLWSQLHPQEVAAVPNPAPTLAAPAAATVADTREARMSMTGTELPTTPVKQAPGVVAQFGAASMEPPPLQSRKSTPAAPVSCDMAVDRWPAAAHMGAAAVDAPLRSRMSTGVLHHHFAGGNPTAASGHMAADPWLSRVPGVATTSVNATNTHSGMPHSPVFTPPHQSPSSVPSLPAGTHPHHAAVLASAAPASAAPAAGYGVGSPFAPASQLAAMEPSHAAGLAKRLSVPFPDAHHSMAHAATAPAPPATPAAHSMQIGVQHSGFVTLERRSGPAKLNLAPLPASPRQHAAGPVSPSSDRPLVPTRSGPAQMDTRPGAEFAAAGASAYFSSDGTGHQPLQPGGALMVPPLNTGGSPTQQQQAPGSPNSMAPGNSCSSGGTGQSAGVAAPLRSPASKRKQSGRLAGEGVDQAAAAAAAAVPLPAPTSTGRTPVWTPPEVEIFLQVLREHGRNFERLMEALPHRPKEQIRNWFNNHKQKLKLNELLIAHGHSTRVVTDNDTTNKKEPSAGGAGTAAPAPPAAAGAADHLNPPTSPKSPKACSKARPGCHKMTPGSHRPHHAAVITHEASGLIGREVPGYAAELAAGRYSSLPAGGHHHDASLPPQHSAPTAWAAADWPGCTAGFDNSMMRACSELPGSSRQHLSGPQAQLDWQHQQHAAHNTAWPQQHPHAASGHASMSAPEFQQQRGSQHSVPGQAGADPISQLPLGQIPPQLLLGDLDGDDLEWLQVLDMLDDGSPGTPTRQQHAPATATAGAPPAGEPAIRQAPSVPPPPPSPAHASPSLHFPAAAAAAVPEACCNSQGAAAHSGFNAATSGVAMSPPAGVATPTNIHSSRAVPAAASTPCSGKRAPPALLVTAAASPPSEPSSSAGLLQPAGTQHSWGPALSPRSMDLMAGLTMEDSSPPPPPQLEFAPPDAAPVAPAATEPAPWAFGDSSSFMETDAPSFTAASGSAGLLGIRQALAASSQADSEQADTSPHKQTVGRRGLGVFCRRETSPEPGFCLPHTAAAATAVSDGRSSVCAAPKSEPACSQAALLLQRVPSGLVCNMPSFSMTMTADEIEQDIVNALLCDTEAGSCDPASAPLPVLSAASELVCCSHVGEPAVSAPLPVLSCWPEDALMEGPGQEEGSAGLPAQRGRSSDLSSLVVLDGEAADCAATWGRVTPSSWPVLAGGSSSSAEEDMYLA